MAWMEQNPAFIHNFRGSFTGHVFQLDLFGYGFQLGKNFCAHGFC